MAKPSEHKQFNSRDVLDPVSRTTEILFGLIMVLSFTCSLSAASAGRSDIRDMLYAALGCNIAWGIIDAFFYLMSEIATRGRERLLVKRLKEISEQDEARELFRDLLPESILESLTPSSYREVRERLLAHKDLERGALITFSDIKGACVIFVLVFLTTFPVALPFLLVGDPWRALRLSNLVAILLLFGLGYNLGRFAGRRPILWGLGLVIVGSMLVSMTIALGG